MLNKTLKMTNFSYRYFIFK